MSLMDRIDENSKVPKYQQVVNNIIADIEDGKLKYSQKIPSINETSERYYLSRDTVEKAYIELKKRGIITSVRGKGYYVASVETSHKIKILLVLNKLSQHKKTVYYSFVNHLSEKAQVDLKIYHYSIDSFKQIIDNSLGDYDFYVVMPHFSGSQEGLVEILSQIPSDKLLMLDKAPEGLRGNYACVYQDFERDILDVLRDASELFDKYHKLYLVFPRSSIHPIEIVKGFIIFCKIIEKDYKIIDDINQEYIQTGEAYIVIEETDLVDLIKKTRQHNLRIGEDIGLISYNESPLKEVLEDGITVISTDFEKMGETAAKMIMEKKKQKIRNPFQLIRRKSI